jgi:ATP-binding cassette, subfamily B, bacterial MsbA
MGDELNSESKLTTVGISDLKIYFRLIGFLKPYLKELILAMLLMGVFAGCMVLQAWLVQPAVKYIFSEKSMSLLYSLALGIVVVFFVKSAADYGRYVLMADIGQKIIMDIRNSLYECIQSQSLRYFVRNPTGILMSRITNDVNMVQGSVTSAVTALVKEVASVIGLLGYAFYMDWQLTFIAIIIFPVVGYFMNRLRKKIKKYARRSMEVMGDINTVLDEAISGIRIVKAFGMEEYEKVRFGSYNHQFYRNWMKRLKIRGIASPLMEAIGGVAAAAIFVVGGMRVINSVMTPEQFFSYVTALFMLYQPIKKINEVNIEIQEGVTAAKRIYDIIDAKPEMEEKPNAIVLGRAEGDVEYRSVEFSYDGDEYALKGISFNAKKGAKIAFVGESGAGKTTIINLLPRFYDVTSGVITIDGYDIRDLTIKSLRANIAMVEQKNILFNDTIRANIAYGWQDAPLETIIEAAKAANAHEFIMEMPDAYETIAGESGVRLSGGQMQRICIARAIMKNAPILVLDEATSALDTESEQEVHAALDRLMENRTTFIIAHRLSTIQGVDRIIALNRGAVVEEGTHEELLARNGYYTRLYNLQFGSDDA